MALLYKSAQQSYVHMRNLSTNLYTFYIFQITPAIMLNFLGKRALVTGAGSGLGRAIAVRLSELKAEVTAVDVAKDRLEKLKEQYSSIHTVQADLCNWQQTKDALQNETPFQLLVNNAGIALLQPMLEVTEDSFDKTFDVNVKALINTTQIVATDLIKRNMKGSIVNISSIAAFKYNNDMGVYGASKAAVNYLTKSMALDLGPKGIRVNAICPSYIQQTDICNIFVEHYSMSDKRLRKAHPLGEIPSLTDIVNSTLFLLHDDSAKTTGLLLTLDSGCTLI